MKLVLCRTDLSAGTETSNLDDWVYFCDNLSIFEELVWFEYLHLILEKKTDKMNLLEGVNNNEYTKRKITVRIVIFFITLLFLIYVFLFLFSLVFWLVNGILIHPWLLWIYFQEFHGQRKSTSYSSLDCRRLVKGTGEESQEIMSRLAPQPRWLAMLRNTSSAIVTSTAVAVVLAYLTSPLTR